MASPELYAREWRQTSLLAKAVAAWVGQKWGRDHFRRAQLWRSLRHGVLLALVGKVYFTEFPEELPPNVALRDVLFGFDLHDIGKADATPDVGVWSLSGNLITPKERRLMARHVEIGAELLREYEAQNGVHFSEATYDVVLRHHERLDGSGGPRGLIGEQLTDVSRLAAVVDSVFSRCERREYHPDVFTLRDAFDAVYQQRGVQYDPEILTRVGSLLQRNLHLTEPGLRWLGGVE